MDRLLRDGRLPDGRIVDIGITEGLICDVIESDASPLDNVGGHDLGGWLVLPALAEPHAHLDKALTAEMWPNPRGDLQGAIEAWIAAAEAGAITHEGIVDRAIKAIELLMVHGATAIRSHVNIGGDLGARNVVAMQEARANFEGLVDIQLVGDDGDSDETQILTFEIVDSPMSGDISDFVSALGSLTYTPNAGFNGSDTFTFRVMDDGDTDNGGSDTSPLGTVTIRVGAPDPPSALGWDGDTHGDVAGPFDDEKYTSAPDPT